MRTLTTAEQAALLRNPIPLAILVEMDLNGAPLNLNTSSLDLSIMSNPAEPFTFGLAPYALTGPAYFSVVTGGAYSPAIHCEVNATLNGTADALRTFYSNSIGTLSIKFQITDTTGYNDTSLIAASDSAGTTSTAFIPRRGGFFDSARRAAVLLGSTVYYCGSSALPANVWMQLDITTLTSGAGSAVIKNLSTGSVISTTSLPSRAAVPFDRFEFYMGSTSSAICSTCEFADLRFTGPITYYGTRGLGTINVVQDTPAEIQPLNFELSGVPSASIALALTEPVRSHPARIKLAIFDPDTYAVLGSHVRWAGLLDVMAIEDGGGTAKLKVSAEHGAIDLLRTSPSLYSDAEQRRLYSNDPSLQFMADQVDMKIVWPAASWRP